MIRSRELSVFFALRQISVLIATAWIILAVAGTASAQVAAFNALGFEWGQDMYEVLIKGNGTAQCSSKYLDNPPRIELNCENVINRIKGTIEAPENPFVHRVMSTASSRPSETKAKLTIALKWKFAYAVEPITDGVIVRMFSRAVQSGTSRAETKTTGSQPPPVVSQTPPVVTEKPEKPVSNTSSTPPPPPVYAATPPAIEPSAQSLDLTNANLVIGVEDLLEINVFQLPEFTLTTRVVGDGSVTMPLVGSVEIAGLTRKNAETKIAQALMAKHVNNPSVSITIKEYKSRQVSILGAVKNPGIYYLTSSRTLLQLLSEAGGLRDDTSGKCFIFRGDSKIEIDLDDLIQNGNQSLNMTMRPGDVINVPAPVRVFAYVLGAVKTPGAVEVSPGGGMTLAGVIARSGGPSKLANISNIQIKRRDTNGNETVLKANLKDILKGKIPDIPILPEDLINVPESFF